MYKRCEFRKNSANDWNESLTRGKFMAKIQNFNSFGDVLPHFCPDKRKIWHGERTEATCSPCGAKNPFLDHWVKTMRFAQACR